MVDHVLEKFYINNYSSICFLVYTALVENTVIFKDV